MADEADIAQTYVLDQNEIALQTITEDLNLRSRKPSLLDCKDCGDPISPERRSLGAVVFCTECQLINDKLSKRIHYTDD